MAQIGWIDFSPAHRERVAAILDMLKPEGVVDELGIGSIRDSLADQMFPGISTIQTRAKYFFIIPYILHEYQLLPMAKKRRKNPGEYLEDREYEIMWELADKYEHKDGTGVIGITKYKPDKIMRRPSAIYWNGLSVFGFIKHGGLGVDTFLKSKNHTADSLLSQMPAGDDALYDDADADYDSTFNLKLPYDKNWAENITLDLTSEESNLLSDHMREAGRGKLISTLLENTDLYKILNSSNSFADFAKTAVKLELNEEVRRVLILAHDFSELMYGAHITYNYILQKEKFSNNYFSENWSKWIKNIKKTMIDYKGFEPDDVLSYTFNVREHTRLFINGWWNFVRSSSHSEKLRNELITNQEYQTKMVKARIKNKNDKYDDVIENQWIGLNKLEYRIPQVKRILSDIKESQKR